MLSHLIRLPYLGLFLVWITINLPSWTWARPPISFASVEASSHHGDIDDLQRTIDGRNASSTGWSLGNQLKSPQAIVFTTTTPIKADLLELSLFFMSGRPHSAFADFAISFTTDAIPSQDGNWTPLPLLNCSAITCQLTTHSHNRIKAEKTPPIETGMIPDDIYRISTRIPGKTVTGFRIEVFPVQRIEREQSVMAWGKSGDFVLTEFRVEVLSTSTNIALGAPVSATHALHAPYHMYQSIPLRYRKMAANAITDGWPSTLAHPGKNIAGKSFYFEIDLGQQRNIDHITLQQRGDNHGLDRFGMMRIKLYDKDPQTDASPIWQTLNRPDGSFPGMGGVDILRAANGKGHFRGRYIRISSENPIPHSPQLAEIEVYETRTPHLVNVTADGLILHQDSQLKIPPAIGRLGFQFEIPQKGQPIGDLYRWKLTGTHKDWQTSNSLLLEMACPPTGTHNLEVQAAHSDGSWDASLLQIPFTVNARFTETAAFIWLIGFATLLIGILFAWYFSQRKINQLKAQSAIEAERARIAANMHDDVGARLAQLSALYDIFEIKYALPPETKAGLTKIRECTHNTIISLDEAVWTFNPRNDRLSALAAFIVQYADSYLSPLRITCQVNSPKEWPDIKTRARNRQKLSLAFKESLQNVVKHANASVVEINLQYSAKQFILTVSDNGIGLSKKDGISGQDGLINMHQHLESIGGSCQWLPRPNGGTTVEMKFPI